MIRILVCFLATAAFFTAMDATWITLATPVLYRPELGGLFIETVRPVPAALFYLIYLCGIVGLAVLPHVDSGRWPRAAGAGALLGLSAYAAYDLTNQATLKVWSTKVTVADLAWGSGATAVAAALAVLVSRRILRLTSTKASSSSTRQP